MATGDSQKKFENLVDDLTNMLQALNTTYAALENEEVKKTKGNNLLKTIQLLAPLFNKISAKAEKCDVLCGKIQNQLESAMKRNAVFLEGRDSGFTESGRDSGFTGLGLYVQETGEEDGNIKAATEDEEFHSAEEPTSSNGEDDS